MLSPFNDYGTIARNQMSQFQDVLAAYFVEADAI